MTPSSKRRKIHGGINDHTTAKINFVSEVINDNGELDYATLISLRNHLLELKDNELEIKLIKSKIKQTFLTGLFCQYNATESKEDKAIFDILHTLERFYQISLRPMLPLVWGERAKDNYEKLRQLGPSLHTKLTADQVLDFLDPKLMWNSLLRSEYTTSMKKLLQVDHSKIYDARFILRLLASLVNEKSEINSRKFIDVNGLSFAFAATSFISRSERCVAYLVLSRFLTHLVNLNGESFLEKCLYIYLLQIFKNSIEHPFQRLPHVVAHFFARVTKLMLHPEDPVYQPLLSFLLLRPNVDAENVPEIYKLLMSSSVLYHNEERRWCLRLITDSLIEPNDYNILQKRYGIKLFLSLFTSTIADMETRKYILLSFRALLQHRSVANDLYVRQNLHSWIVLTLQEKTLTGWERIFLCQLFVSLMTHIKEICCADSNGNVAEKKWHKNITQKTCRILGNKVLIELKKSTNDGKNIWLLKLKDLLSSDPWFSPVNAV